MMYPSWTCKALERAVVAFLMGAMPSGRDQAWYTTGADAHRGPAEDDKSRRDMWIDERLAAMGTLGRYSSIASRCQYGLNADRWENMLGRY